MLTLSPRQIDRFEEGALAAYRHELLVHCQAHAPELWRIAGEPAFVAFVDDTTRQAMALGLSQRGPMRLYVEVALELGQGFQTDPQYARLWPAGDPAGMPMPFAQQLLANHRQFAQACVGERAQWRTAALQALLSISFDADVNVDTWARDSLRAAYPQKLDYTGEDAFFALCEACAGVADGLQLRSPRGRFLVVVLALCFGVQVMNNPLYPWLARRLRDAAPEAERVNSTVTALRLYAERVIKTLEAED